MPAVARPMQRLPFIPDLPEPWDGAVVISAPAFATLEVWGQSLCFVNVRAMRLSALHPRRSMVSAIAERCGWPDGIDLGLAVQRVRLSSGNARRPALSPRPG